MKTMDFRKSVIEFTDYWRGGAVRVARYTGKCIVCGCRTFEFDDGENDPRGALGDRANSALIASEYGYTGKDVPMCFLCGNDTEAKYKRGLWRAMRKWGAPKADIMQINREYIECVTKGY
jgi:hypothetical protein